MNPILKKLLILATVSFICYMSGVGLLFLVDWRLIPALMFLAAADVIEGKMKQIYEDYERNAVNRTRE